MYMSESKRNCVTLFYLQEINLLNQLCHPNIVQYYGSELVCINICELQEKKRSYMLVEFGQRNIVI